VTRADYPNGTYTEYAYNSQRNWLTTLVNKNSTDATLTSFSYTYDAVGNRLSVAEHDGSAVVYAYDDIYQLTSETRTGTNPYSVTYQYDDVGNRTQMVKNAVTTTFDHEFVLRGSQAISANIAWFAQHRNIKYIYFGGGGLAGGGHGGYEFDNKFRTGIELSDGICFSVRRSDYSDPCQAPSWCKALGAAHESGDTLSFAQMGFNSLEFVLLDCCYTGRLYISGSSLNIGEEGEFRVYDDYNSDMSWALGNPVYQGWYDLCPIGTTSTFSRFVKQEFEQLRDGGAVLKTALDYAINHSEMDRTALRDPAEDCRIRGNVGGVWTLRIDVD